MTIPTNKDIFKHLSMRIVQEQWERFWTFFWNDECPGEKGGRLGILAGSISYLVVFYVSITSLKTQLSSYTPAMAEEKIGMLCILLFFGVVAFPGIGYLLGRGIVWCIYHLMGTWDSIYRKWNETKSKLSGGSNDRTH